MTAVNRPFLYDGLIFSMRPASGATTFIAGSEVVFHLTIQNTSNRVREGRVFVRLLYDSAIGRTYINPVEIVVPPSGLLTIESRFPNATWMAGIVMAELLVFGSIEDGAKLTPDEVAAGYDRNPPMGHTAPLCSFRVLDPDEEKSRLAEEGARRKEADDREGRESKRTRILTIIGLVSAAGIFATLIVLIWTR